jgi:diguanylate cyclase (GGDEF)-like protein
MSIELGTDGAVVEEDRQLAELGPLAASGRMRRLAPFGFVVTCAIVSMAFDSDGSRGAFVVIACLGAATMVAAALLPWHRLPRRAQGAVAIVPIFLLVAAVRVDGGLDSHFLALLLLPLMWLALYETRRCLNIGLVATISLLAMELVRQPVADKSLRAFAVIALAVGLLPPVRRLVTMNRSALLTIADMANRDSLTGLANRRGLERGITAHENRSSDGLGMIFVDLNCFKIINDTFGHDAGDDLLVQVGNRLVAATRSQDVVARVGGDEFVIACYIPRAAVAALADRIRNVIGDSPYQLRGEQVSVSASVGCSHMCAPALNTAALLDEADHAMYVAKAGGSDPAPLRDAPLGPSRTGHPVGDEVLGATVFPVDPRCHGARPAPPYGDPLRPCAVALGSVRGGRFALGR